MAHPSGYGATFGLYPCCRDRDSTKYGPRFGNPFPALPKGTILSRCSCQSLTPCIILTASEEEIALTMEPPPGGSDNPDYDKRSTAES